MIRYDRLYISRRKFIFKSKFKTKDSSVLIFSMHNHTHIQIYWHSVISTPNAMSSIGCALSQWETPPLENVLNKDFTAMHLTKAIAGVWA